MYEFCPPSRGIEVPADREWYQEIKYDGFRLRVERDGNRVRLITRGGYDVPKAAAKTPTAKKPPAIDANHMADDQRGGMAIHEAGHAIVAHGLGLRITRAVIAIHGDIVAGHVEIEETQSMSVPDRLALCSAGSMAQELFNAPVNDYCASEDARQIYELIGHLPEAVGRTLRDLGYEKAHELIERNREKVAAVAEALAQRLELSEAEIAALLT
jgi:hypothetical protein